MTAPRATFPFAASRIQIILTLATAAPSASALVTVGKDEFEDAAGVIAMLGVGDADRGEPRSGEQDQDNDGVCADNPREHRHLHRSANTRCRAEQSSRTRGVP
ncbi:hypothetical protein SAMN05216266_120105 [Amycolatopsis marina]|uniref:Uncharacterized protein n=1 Tax=Amycolatopsis marina TaxID=490629 RepID=A0A1I1C3I4_9PSEU|nr:hypothetical protein [Amycolatopsis marina]SFB57081.1 hypothetical protein SAMN05216266_120105 [Amycolatopsis marina]